MDMHNEESSPAIEPACPANGSQCQNSERSKLTLVDDEYIAFISYRHMPTDSYVAKRLHWLLEHYKPPKEYANGKRLGRVFRDEDELPASSNLTNLIKDALDRSRFLLVVCTEATPESIWVHREISYFLEHHDRSHIIAVLVQGKPDDSFPEELTKIFEEDGVTVKEYIEPLAANLTDDYRQFSKRRMKREVYRIFAAILACPYDSLWQRERRYRLKRGIFLMLGLFLTSLCFSLYILSKNLEIHQQNLQITEKNRSIQRQNEEINEKAKEISRQSVQSLVNEGLLLLESGQRIEAIRKGVSALSLAKEEDTENVTDAEYLMNSALKIGEYGIESPIEHMYEDAVVQQDTDIEQLALSDDAVFTADRFGTIRSFSSFDGKLLWTATVKKRNDNADIARVKKQRLYVLNKYDMLLCCFENHISALSMSDGSLIWAYEKKANSYYGDDYWHVSEELGVMAVISTMTDGFSLNEYTQPETRKLILLDLENGWAKESLSLPEEIIKAERIYSYGKETGCFSGDGRYFAGFIYTSSGTGYPKSYKSVYFLTDFEAGDTKIVYSSVCPTEPEDYSGNEFMIGMDVNEKSEIITGIRYEGDKQKLCFEVIGFDGTLNDSRSIQQVLNTDTGFYMLPIWTYYYNSGIDIYACCNEMCYEYDPYNKKLSSYKAMPGNYIYFDLQVLSGSLSRICLFDNGGLLFASGAGYEYKPIINKQHIVLFSHIGSFVNEYPSRFGYTLNKDYVQAIVCDDNLKKVYIIKASNHTDHIHELSAIPDYDDCLSVQSIPGNKYLFLLSYEGKYTGSEGNFVIDVFDPKSKELIRTIKVPDHQNAPYHYDLENGLMGLDMEGKKIWIYDNNDASSRLMCIDFDGNELECYEEEGFTNIVYDVCNNGNMLYAALQKGPSLQTGSFNNAANEREVRLFWRYGKESGGTINPDGKLWALPDKSYNYNPRLSSKENREYAETSVVPVLKTGENGFILVGQYSSSEDIRTESFLLYNTANDKSVVIEDQCPGKADRKLFLAKASPFFGALDEDGKMRVYDIQKKSVCMETDIPFPTDMIANAVFCMDDQYILLQSKDGIFCVCNVKTKETVYQGSLNNKIYGLAVDWDKDGKRIYISAADRYQDFREGVCIDVRTWTKSMDIPSLMTYCDTTKEIYGIQNKSTFVYYSINSPEELIEMGREISEPVESDIKTMRGWIKKKNKEGKEEYIYLGTDGNPVKSSWVQRNGKDWFYLNEDGHILKGEAFRDGGNLYYLNAENGQMLTDSWAEVFDREKGTYHWACFGTDGKALISGTAERLDGSIWKFDSNAYANETGEKGLKSGWRFENGTYVYYGLSVKTRNIYEPWRKNGDFLFEREDDDKIVSEEEPGELCFTENGNLYCYKTSDGRAVKDQWVCVPDGSGQKIWYYFDKNGIAPTSGRYKRPDGSTWEFGKDGMAWDVAVKRKGWWIEDGEFVYYDSDGTPVRSQFVENNGYTFYLDENGKVAKGRKFIDDDLYAFIGDGEIITNTAIILKDNLCVLYEADGKARKSGTYNDKGDIYEFSDDGLGTLTNGEKSGGWIKEDDSFHYYRENGELVKDEIVERSYYSVYLDKEGEIYKEGLFNLGGKTYYSHEEHGELAMDEWIELEDEKTGEKEWRYFDSDGRLSRRS